MAFPPIASSCLLVILLHNLKSGDAEQVAKDDSTFKLPPMTIQHLTEEQLSKHPRKHRKDNQHNVRSLAVPVTFNAADKWPNCTSIRTIRDQGACGDCWAVSSASVLSDRFCIAKGKTDFISANQVAGCTYPAYSTTDKGGNMADAYKKATLTGFATGGEYGSGVGCIPYTIGPGNSQRSISCIVPPPTGSGSCSNPAYTTPMADDAANFKPDSYWIDFNPGTAMMIQSNIDASVAHMKDEIYSHGPITAVIMIYTDFQHWKNSPATPYYAGPSPTASYVGAHGVRLTGWGQSLNGVSYWIVANSWGPNVGENGHYWVKMGSNVIGIEQNISAPIIEMSASIKCDAALFCTAPVDQAVSLKFNDPTSPQYLFQGPCTMKVKTISGKLIPDGPSGPVQKQFLNIQTSIVNQILYNGGISLINAAGVGGNNCAFLAGSAKIGCSNALWPSFSGPRAYVAFPSGVTFAWSTTNPAFIQVGQQSTLGYSYRSFNFFPPYNLPRGTAITAFLYINSTCGYVFAKDFGGRPLTGLIMWPVPLNGGAFMWAKPLGPPSTLQACV